MSFKLCLVVTDAVSFNVLYRGQLEYLSKHDFDLTLICGGSHSELDALRNRNVGDVVDIGLVRQPKPWLDIVCLARLIRHFKKHRYDLVITSTPKALLLGSIAIFVTGQSRRIAFFQGRIYENFRGLRRFIYRTLDYITLACVQDALFVSKSLLTEVVKELPVAKKKGLVLGKGSGNGVCLEKFSPAAISSNVLKSLKTELRIDDSEVIVLVVGRVCLDKGLNELVDVVRRTALSKQKIRFILVGQIEEDIARQIILPFITAGLVNHVDFTPDVVPYFALADIHLFLTHREGFGNVAIEAAAMGVPTISFDVVGLQDSVAEGISGRRLLFGDTESVAAAILSIRDDLKSGHRIFPNARSWVADNFSQIDVWEKYKEFYIKGRKVEELR